MMGGVSAGKVTKKSVPKPKSTKTKSSSNFEVSESHSFTVNDGPVSTTFRKFVQQRHSDSFLGKRIITVPSSREHVEMREKETEDGSYFKITDDCFRVETEDGFGLIMVIKGGMYAGKSETGADLRQMSETAFEDLIKVYPPAEPQCSDYRHVVAQETEKADWLRKGLPWGRLLLVPWHATGNPHGPLYLSTHARPKAQKLAAVKDFMTALSWEHDQISLWLKSLDNVAWTEMNRHYQELRDNGTLEHLDQGPNGIHPGFAPIVNLTAQPHKDPGDDKLSWTTTNAWGDYEGAWAVFPESKIMVKMEPGDIIFCRAAYVEHWITRILSGQRFCNTRFTKGDVAHPLPTTINCPIPECGNMYGRVSSLRGHIPDKHDGLSDEAVDAIIAEVELEASAFSVSEAKEIGRWLKGRVADRKKRKEQRSATQKKRRGKGVGHGSRGVSKDVPQTTE